MALFWFRQQDAQLTAANGTVATLNFKDGSSTVLNDGSSITFNEREWNKARTIQLEGEALFQVQPGQKFTVQTSNGQVEVLGTTFNVRAWGDKLSVECYEGKVRVSRNGMETIVSQSQSVLFNSGLPPVKEVINHQKPLWSTGTSTFKNETIQEVLKELERQYNVVVDASGIKKRLYWNLSTRRPTPSFDRHL